MRHSDFTGQGHYDKLGIEMSGPAQGDYITGFQLSNAYSLSFLNGLLKNQSLQNFNNSFQQAAKDSLVNRKVIKVKEVKNYEYQDLIKLVFDQEFDRLFDVYEQHQHLEIKAFSYSTFLDVEMMLYFRAHYNESLKWFQFFVKSYPNSVRAHYQMPNCLRRLGENNATIPVLEAAQNVLDTDEFLTDDQKTLYEGRIKRVLKKLEEL